MNPEVRSLLLDLEAGRWADDPDVALLYLGRLYLELGSYDVMQEQIEELQDELMRLEMGLS